MAKIYPNKSEDLQASLFDKPVGGLVGLMLWTVLAKDPAVKCAGEKLLRLEYIAFPHQNNRFKISQSVS